MAVIHDAAAKLRRYQQAKEELHWPDQSWDRLKADTTAPQSVRGKNYYLALSGNSMFVY